MISINMCIVAGYVGGEPKISTTQTGKKVASFSIATTEKGYTTRDGGQIPDRTEWHNIICWGGIAEVVDRYVRKGSALHIMGKMRTRSYSDKSGQTRYVAEIECDNLQFLDRADGGRANSPQQKTQQPQQPTRAEYNDPF